MILFRNGGVAVSPSAKNSEQQHPDIKSKTGYPPRTVGLSHRELLHQIHQEAEKRQSLKSGLP